MKQASLITLGCKVNSFDSAVIWEGLEEKGYRVSEEIGGADVCVINTCTVTNSAGSNSRQIVRKVKRINPDSLVIVTGCHAQMNPHDISSIEGVDYVVGNREKRQILDIINNAEKGSGKRVAVSDMSGIKDMNIARLSTFKNRHRAFLKIQDGCEAFCTYCIIPYARGGSRSLPAEEVLEQAMSLAGAGFSEIILTGIHLGGYGLDLSGKETLFSLLCKLDALDVDARFRISSVEPTEIDDGMIEFLSTSGKICRHLHIPLQSGDQGILEKMGRRYTPSCYRKKIERIASKWSGVAIGVDIMAGFPGEDEDAFQNSYRLLRDLPAAYFHVFPYSKRDGTPAAVMRNQVAPEEAKGRCALLRKLGDEKKKEFCRGFLGERLEVVGIGTKKGRLKTLSDNYIEVMIDQRGAPSNSLFEVEIDLVDSYSCRGKVI